MSRRVDDATKHAIYKAFKTVTELTLYQKQWRSASEWIYIIRYHYGCSVNEADGSSPMLIVNDREIDHILSPETLHDAILFHSDQIERVDKSMQLEEKKTSTIELTEEDSNSNSGDATSTTIPPPPKIGMFWRQATTHEKYTYKTKILEQVKEKIITTQWNFYCAIPFFDAIPNYTIRPSCCRCASSSSGNDTSGTAAAAATTNNATETTATNSGRKRKRRVATTYIYRKRDRIYSEYRCSQDIIVASKIPKHEFGLNSSSAADNENNISNDIASEEQSMSRSHAIKKGIEALVKAAERKKRSAESSSVLPASSPPAGATTDAESAATKKAKTSAAAVAAAVQKLKVQAGATTTDETDTAEAEPTTPIDISSIIDRWKSTEAIKLFGPLIDDKEDVRDAIKRRISILEKAIYTENGNDGYQHIIEGGDPFNRCTTTMRFRIRQKAILMRLALMIALKEWPFKKWSQCCMDAGQKANEVLGDFKPLKGTIVKQDWPTFRQKNCFPHPMGENATKENYKRKERSPLLMENPEFREKLEEFCRNNVRHLNSITLNEYLTNVLFPIAAVNNGFTFDDDDNDDDAGKNKSDEANIEKGTGDGDDNDDNNRNGGGSVGLQNNTNSESSNSQADDNQNNTDQIATTTEATAATAKMNKTYFSTRDLTEEQKEKLDKWIQKRYKVSLFPSKSTAWHILHKLGYKFNDKSKSFSTTSNPREEDEEEEG